MEPSAYSTQYLHKYGHGPVFAKRYLRPVGGMPVARPMLKTPVYSNRFIGNDHELYKGCMKRNGLVDKYYMKDRDYQADMDRRYREEKQTNLVYHAQGKLFHNNQANYCQGSYAVTPLSKVLYTTQGAFYSNLE